MPVPSAIRNLVFLGLALSAGWWLRGANSPVLAQHAISSSSHSASTGSGDSLAFQVNGSGPDSTLMVYNPGNHTLYFYPRIGAGNSSVNCSTSFRIDRPGAPIERGGCPVGELLPPH